MKQYRQGDVLVQRVRNNPKLKPHTKVEREAGRIILAHGEATGHAHAIADAQVELIELEGGERFLCTAAGIRLVHEEHATVEIPAGNYRVTRQREYQPEGIRNVRD